MTRLTTGVKSPLSTDDLQNVVDRVELKFKKSIFTPTIAAAPVAVTVVPSEAAVVVSVCEEGCHCNVCLNKMLDQMIINSEKALKDMEANLAPKAVELDIDENINYIGFKQI